MKKQDYLFRRAILMLQGVGVLPRPVQGIHRTFDDWLSTVDQLDTSEKYWKRVCTPAKIFPKVSPETLIADPGTVFDTAASDNGETYREGEKFIAHIGGGIVGTENCELVTPDRWLIHELLLNDIVLKKKFVRSTQLFWPLHITQQSGHYATIYSSFIRSNYSHFVLDALPRLQYLEGIGVLSDAQIVVPATMPRYQSDLLQLMGYNKSRWYLTDDSTYTSFEHLYAASFPQDVYWYPNPDACRELKKRLLGIVSPVGDLPRRIFVSRKESSFRRILNEDLMSCLTKDFGFVEIVTEKLSVIEQINLFRHAEIVVAPHGAGLTNILYMPEGSVVVELAGSWHRLPTYVNLAGGLGLRYAYVTTSSKYQQLHKNDNYVMPVERVLAAFDQLNISSV
jgi:hypothetical protein